MDFIENFAIFFNVLQNIEGANDVKFLVIRNAPGIHLEKLRFTDALCSIG